MFETGSVLNHYSYIKIFLMYKDIFDTNYHRQL